MSQRKLLVTHHAPDLDAIGSVWLFKRFDPLNYADAKVAFVDPGDKISLEDCEKNYNCQLHEVTHVDTGLGEFDHHQVERAAPNISASSLVYDYICKHYPDKKDDQALAAVVKHITEIDHFNEINWAEAKEDRFTFSLHSLIHGHEFVNLHNDQSQLNFGLEALDYAYAALTQRYSAKETIKKKGQEFNINIGLCLAIESGNDDTIKLAQIQGYQLVVRKDSEQGFIRIKARPDSKNPDGSSFDLKKLEEAISQLDQSATWFYHASGKMLLNGSSGWRQKKASKLSLKQVVDLIKKIYS
ncbi:MAG: hypothetical protein GX943_02945 [Candidatus Pacebacteria bacterium]|jgi:hypothetical protein|nr:hypothetical protein [Candidatus Paceibacterota bacterium]